MPLIRLKNSEKTLLTNTSNTSLAKTPNTKAIPPLYPLFKLCLMIENNTGPTAKLSHNPNVRPFSNASVIIQGPATIAYRLLIKLSLFL